MVFVVLLVEQPVNVLVLVLLSLLHILDALVKLAVFPLGRQPIVVQLKRQFQCELYLFDPFYQFLALLSQCVCIHPLLLCLKP